jgi:hypothetical protein
MIGEGFDDVASQAFEGMDVQLDFCYSFHGPHSWAVCPESSVLVFIFVYPGIHSDVCSHRDQRWNLSAASSGPSDRYFGHASHFPRKEA